MLCRLRGANTCGRPQERKEARHSMRGYLPCQIANVDCVLGMEPHADRPVATGRGLSGVGFVSATWWRGNCKGFAAADDSTRRSEEPTRSWRRTWSAPALLCQRASSHRRRMQWAGRWPGRVRSAGQQYFLCGGAARGISSCREEARELFCRGMIYLFIHNPVRMHSPRAVCDLSIPDPVSPVTKKI